MRELIVLAVALQPAFGMQDIAVGKKLYAAHCAACHGPKGEGGRGARLITVARAPESLVSVIQKGIPGTEMPPAPLTDREIRDVAAFVGGLQRDSVVQGAAGSSRGEE